MNEEQERKPGEGAEDFLGEAVGRLAHEVMEEEVRARVGADLHEPSLERTTHQNG